MHLNFFSTKVGEWNINLENFGPADNLQLLVTSLLAEGKEEIKVQASFKYPVVNFSGKPKLIIYQYMLTKLLNIKPQFYIVASNE